MTEQQYRENVNEGISKIVTFKINMYNNTIREIKEIQEWCLWNAKTAPISVLQSVAKRLTDYPNTDLYLSKIE